MTAGEGEGGEVMIEVACAGCGRTRRVSRKKYVPCAYYTCFVTGCIRDPEFRGPKPPGGFIYEAVEVAVGALYGHRLRQMTPEDLECLEWLKAMLRRALEEEGKEVPAWAAPSDPKAN
jgi:hypothetical protein